MNKEPTDTLVLGENLNKTMLVSGKDWSQSFNSDGVFEEWSAIKQRMGAYWSDPEKLQPQLIESLL